jgi:hypothetical protein
VRARLVRRELGLLRSESVPAPGHLSGSVLYRLGEQDAADPRRVLALRLAFRRAAFAGMGAAATAAAVITGVVRRRSRLAG